MAAATMSRAAGSLSLFRGLAVRCGLTTTQAAGMATEVRAAAVALQGILGMEDMYQYAD